jgi:hypothetical protein
MISLQDVFLQLNQEVLYNDWLPDIYSPSNLYRLRPCSTASVSFRHPTQTELYLRENARCHLY